jgi:hypothetical protein
MSAREIIAEIIATHDDTEVLHLVHPDGYCEGCKNTPCIDNSALRLADAILAALPDMIPPLVWVKKIIEPTGVGSREDPGGWTMTCKTPLKSITIDFHEQHAQKGIKFPYYSNTCGPFDNEAEVIKATEAHYVTSVMAALNGEAKT